MNNEISMAFAHPSERAEASKTQFCDRISLRDFIVEVEIGAFQQERGHLQRVCFNVVVEVIPQTGEIDDDVDRILSYDRVTEAIHIELGAERLNLLETLAARVAERILREPQALRVFVRIEKLDRGPFALGVEIVRSKDEVARTDQDQEQVPHPVVLHLSNAAIESERLSTWIDQLATKDAPLVITVGAGELPVPKSTEELAQRRINLLAIEQNAWVLAGRDKRCVVVGTRTELDWAMKHNQISVWAPSKIVLDTIEGPISASEDSLALAVWFAEEMQAARIVVIGCDAPETSIPLDVINL